MFIEYAFHRRDIITADEIVVIIIPCQYLFDVNYVGFATFIIAHFNYQSRTMFATWQWYCASPKQNNDVILKCHLHKPESRIYFEQNSNSSSFHINRHHKYNLSAIYKVNRKTNIKNIVNRYLVYNIVIAEF